MQADQNNSHPQTGIPVPAASVVIYPPSHWPGQTTPPTGFRSAAGPRDQNQQDNQKASQQGNDDSQQGQGQGQGQGQKQAKGQGRGRGQGQAQGQEQGQGQKNNQGQHQGTQGGGNPQEGQGNPFHMGPAPFAGGFTPLGGGSPIMGGNSPMMVAGTFPFGAPAYGYTVPAAQPMYTTSAAPVMSAGTNALTEKDLLLLVELMALEMNAARKYRHFAQSAGDDGVTTALERASQMHQRHLKVMLQHCQVGGMSLWS
ncbi:hypothetical protein GTO91_10950 [Heliobacterium undosum]|uniref:Uncharacterized protein n=1 Tax=Heliomicrobium undosum TaxID=121734 RepID=A0A845L3E4_9FIRM|nr:hypothetical protein [Heliomicrobium undosum]MZP30226.1 hypothetical protein [Heliomicrobium undosum]